STSERMPSLISSDTRQKRLTNLVRITAPQMRSSLIPCTAHTDGYASSIPQVRPLSVRSGLSASPIWLIGDESSADRVAAMPHGTNERQSSSECASDGGGAEAACRALPQPPDSSCRCQNGHLPRNGIE